MWLHRSCVRRRGTPRLELTVARGSTPSGRSGLKKRLRGAAPATRLIRDDRDTRLSITQAIRLCKFQGVDRTLLHDGYRRPADDRLKTRVMKVLDRQGRSERLRAFQSVRQISIQGSGQGCPLLRASNEHILIVRVLRARRAPGRSLPIPSEAARCARTGGTHRAISPLPDDVLSILLMPLLLGWRRSFAGPPDRNVPEPVGRDPVWLIDVA
jgi:hypothetical protein